MNKLRSAVIYARISSVKQATEGDGIESQVATCLEFANKKIVGC